MTFNIHFQFSIVKPRVQNDAIMAGPKLPNVEAHNQFTPDPKKVEGQLAMVGPVFQGVEHKSHFKPEGERVQGELAMTAPKYRGVIDSRFGAGGVSRKNIFLKTPFFIPFPANTTLRRRGSLPSPP